MLFNGQKLSDLLYLQESLDESEKAHQGLLYSFRLVTFLFNTVNFIFPYSSDFPCGENFKKALSPAKLQVKEIKQMTSCGTSQKSLVHAPRIYQRDIFLLQQLMPTENKNTENVISGSAVDSPNSG